MPIPVAVLALAPVLAPLQTPWIAEESAELTAGDPSSPALFGGAVAIAGTTAVVGARLDANPGALAAGSAYVFELSAGSWSQVAKLVAPSPQTNDRFGDSVAVFGDTIVVGAESYDFAPGVSSGAAFVFERDLGGASAWGLAQVIFASDATSNTAFGYSLALDGDRLAVGAPSDSHSGFSIAGSVYVFERGLEGNGAFGEVAKLTASDPGDLDFFGNVALHGDTVLVGAPGDTFGGKEAAGSAYLFERDEGGPGAWGQAQKLTASDPLAEDAFGTSVAIHDDHALVGAFTSGFFDFGAAYLFRDTGSGWSETLKLAASDAALSDHFGTSVALTADTAAIGAEAVDVGAQINAGAVYLFERHVGGQDAWSETNLLTAGNAAAGDVYGTAVALDTGALLIGAQGTDHTGFGNAGSAYVVGLEPSSETYCTAGVSASGCAAAIGASGLASATAPTGFVVSATNVEGDKDGLFFFGAGGRQANAWGNGSSFQCVVPPVRRGGVLAGSGAAGACDGAFAQDLNARWCGTCPKPAQNPGAGVVAEVQLWYRDPLSTSNRTTSLSNALEFLVVP
jgi:hypothetical protein